MVVSRVDSAGYVAKRCCVDTFQYLLVREDTGWLQGGARVREDAQESKAAAAMTAITSNISFLKHVLLRLGYKRLRLVFHSRRSTVIK